MLLVILGAGASFDSYASRPASSGQYRAMDHRPPLADELFGDRHHFGAVMERYGKCLDIATRLRHLPEGVSIEKVLQDLQSEAGEYPERVQQLVSVRYYLQDILYHCSTNWWNSCQGMLNHRQLLDDIKRWHRKGSRVCFVTFNYDILIDYAFASTGFPISNFKDYISQEFLLIKLHGSVNWGRIVRTPLTRDLLDSPDKMARELISRFGEIQITKEYVMGTNPPPASNSDYGVVPALAIPVESKLEFECPEELVEALKSFIPHVTKVLIIGWRGTERPFLDLLKNGLRNSKAHFMIVNGSDWHSQDTANRLMKELGISATVTALRDGFTEFIVQHKGKDFLSA
jgi:hypothetical protein